MIVITGTAEIAAENRDAFRPVAERQVRLSRAEPGNVSYGYYEDQMSPGRFFFYEEWRDRAAVDLHFAQSYCLEFVAEARRLAATPPEISIREVVVKEG